MGSRGDWGGWSGGGKWRQSYLNNTQKLKKNQLSTKPQNEKNVIKGK